MKKLTLADILLILANQRKKLKDLCYKLKFCQIVLEKYTYLKKDDFFSLILILQESFDIIKTINNSFYNSHKTTCINNMKSYINVNIVIDENELRKKQLKS